MSPRGALYTPDVVVKKGHFGEWPVTSAGARSLARLTQFVRMFTPVAAKGRCSR